MKVEFPDLTSLFAIISYLTVIAAGVWKTAFAVGKLVRTQSEHTERIADHTEQLSQHDRRLQNHEQRLTKLDGEVYED